MSTKSSLTAGDSFHLYHEPFDRGVYLTLSGDVEFEASQHEVTVRIPIHIWEHIRQHGSFKPHYQLMDDRALMEHVTKKVDERIEAYADPSKPGLRGLLRTWVYGPAHLPREEQIKRGFEYLSKRRADEREIAERIRALNEAKK